MRAPPEDEKLLLSDCEDIQFPRLTCPNQAAPGAFEVFIANGGANADIRFS
jgi:hypothetical protein